jgi:ubiquinone/menaquinone biosynthesis C-methylase UbiE
LWKKLGEEMEETLKTKRRYNRQAFLYDLMEWPMEKALFSNWRRQLLTQVRGKVLEIGVGTGKNLPYYSPEVELTAIDVSEKMLRRAERRALALGRRVDFHLMDAQHLEFADETFDTVLATFVFCSVPDPIQGLKEARRVLKSARAKALVNSQNAEKSKEPTTAGLLLLEHVRIPNGFAGTVMDVLDPLTVRLGGFHINRRTVQNVIDVGFRGIQISNLKGELFKLIKAVK